MDIFYYDSDTNKRLAVPIEAQTAIFSGATSTKHGTSGLVPTPTTADVGKFLSASGRWEDIPDEYLLQTEAENLFVSKTDTISAETSKTAKTADALTQPQTITIQDNHGNTASGKFTGSSTTVITLPDAMFTNVTVASAMQASQASEATTALNAETADQLSKKVKITITDSAGTTLGTTTETDFSDDVILKMPPVTAATGNTTPTGTIRIYITDGENNGNTESIGFDNADHGIRLPGKISADITGNADTATAFKTPVKLALESGDITTNPVDIIGNEGSSTKVLKLPTIITATLKGTADKALTASSDTAGHLITSWYAPITSPHFDGSPTANTPDATETSQTRIATIGYVKRAIANQLGISYEGEGAGTLSLVEISKSINHDPNFAKMISDTYLRQTTLLSSMLELPTNVTENNMFYTDSDNHVAVTKIFSVGRDLLAATDTAMARDAIGAISVNGTVARAVQLSNPISITIEDKNGHRAHKDEIILSGSENITIKVDETVSFNLSSETVVYSAGEWTSPIQMSVSDKSGKHKGTEQSVNAKQNVVLPLPDTITAALFDGTAKEAAALKTPVTISVTDGENITERNDRTMYHGTETAISLVLPKTIKATNFLGIATSARKLESPVSIYLQDKLETPIAEGLITGSSTTIMKLADEISVDISGTAETANKLTTGRSLQVTLNSATPVTFDGSSDVTAIPITGILPVAHGGTGSNSLSVLTVGKANKLSSARIIMGGTFDGSTDVSLFGTCITEPSTAIKQVDISSVSALSNGLVIAVYFSRDNTASAPKLRVNNLTACDMIGPDGRTMINQKIGLYNFVYYDNKFYTTRIPDIETASYADKAFKDDEDRIIKNTYAEKKEAIGNIYLGSSDNYVLYYQKISEIGTTTYNYINLPKFAETDQEKTTDGTYPLLQATNSVTTKITSGKPKFNPAIKVDNTKGILMVPQLQADVLILPTESSTTPGAIWIEG